VGPAPNVSTSPKGSDLDYCRMAKFCFGPVLECTSVVELCAGLPNRRGEFWNLNLTSAGPHQHILLRSSTGMYLSSRVMYRITEQVGRILEPAQGRSRAG
jgi:hypothetical protein